MINDINQLDGMELLSDQDLATLNQFIEKEKLQRITPLPESFARKKKTDPVQVPARVRRAGLKPSTMEGMNVIFTNADQLTPSKKTELMKHVEKVKPLVIAVCEVKPKHGKEHDIMDYEIPDYTLHSVNLGPNSNGRGVAVFTHSSIEKSTIQIQPDLSFEEACLIEIKLRGGDILLFGCFYRSPTEKDNSDFNNCRLNNLLRAISSKRYSHCCILGDFNYRAINWMTLSTPHGEKSKESQFVETIRDCFLHQHISETTRRRGQDEPSLIDLLFTDEPMQVSNIIHHAPLGKSDHNVISFKFHCYLDYTKPKDRYAYEKADFQGMRDHLDEIKWKDGYLNLATNENKDELWKSIKTVIHEMRDTFVPVISPTGNPKWKTSGSIPVDKKLQEAIRDKTRNHRRWMRAKSRGDADVTRLEYSRASKKVKQLMRKAKRDFEKNICQNPKNNPKKFWWYVRHKLKTKSGVAPLLENVKDRESMKFDDQDKANILQRQFSGVFTREPDTEIPELPKRTKTNVRSPMVTETMVRKEILRLKVNKSCGPDDVHPQNVA